MGRLDTGHRLFYLPPDVAAELDKWAAKKGEGGWQNLCAKILAGELDPNEVERRQVLKGIRKARQVLEDLETAEENE